MKAFAQPTRSAVVRALGPMGIYRLAKYLTRADPRILMYHRFSDTTRKNRVSTGDFVSQVTLLRDNFNIMSLPDLVEALSPGRKVPDNSIVITVDDGYRDFYEVAYPVLKHYGLPATIYLTTDFVDGKIWLWPDKIHYLLKTSALESLSVDLGTRHVEMQLKADPARCWSMLNDHCIALPDSEKHLFIDKLSDLLGVSLPPAPTEEYAPMDWDMVADLAANNVTIGAHTRSHPILTRLTGDALDDEIAGCKAILEQQLGIPVSCFCYPNGQAADYSPAIKQLVKDSGYTNATVAFNDASKTADLFELRRHPVDGNMFQFNKSISGLELIGHRLRR